jgi:hypothetical protein
VLSSLESGPHNLYHDGHESKSAHMLYMIKLILERGGGFEVYGRAVMMALARKRDEARNKLNKE